MSQIDIDKIKPGDLFIIPPHGPGRVVSIEREAAKVVLVFPAGHQLELSPEELQQDARLPVEKAQADTARAHLQKPDVEPDQTPFEEGFKERMQVVSSGDLEKMAMLLRKLAARSDPASPGEQRFLQNLEDQVLVELAEVLGLNRALLAQELKQAISPRNPIEPQQPQEPKPIAVPRETKASSTPPKVACYRHPESPATDTCPRCLKPMCDVCAMPSASGFLCPKCNRSRQQRSLFIKIAGFFLISGLLLGGGIFFLSHYEPPFDYGTDAAKVHQLTKRLEKDPCDRVKMLKLAELLLEAGDHQRAVNDSKRFLAECGEFNRLLWITYEANKRMGEYDAAITEVSALISAHPFDKDFRWWRAEAHARKRDWKNALADYRQALGLQPRLHSIPYEMARVAKEIGKPCDGIMPIEQLVYHHPSAAQDANLLHRLETLYRMPACQGMAGTGFAALPLGADETAIEVKLPGEQVGRFRVQLGSPYTLLSEALAKRIGLAQGQAFLIWDGREVHEGKILRLDSLQVEEARAEQVDVVIVKELPEGEDGRLGLSFLSRFALRIDPDSNTLELSPKLAD